MTPSTPANWPKDGSMTMVLKTTPLCGSSEVKDTIVVGVYYSRDETGSLLRPDLTQALSCKVLIIMAWNQVPYIHVILADVVSIT